MNILPIMHYLPSRLSPFSLNPRGLLNKSEQRGPFGAVERAATRFGLACLRVLMGAGP